MTELTLIWEASVSPAYCWLQFRYSYLCVRVCVCCCGLGEPAVNPLSNMVERLPHLFLFHKTEQRSLLSLVDHGGGIKAALVYCRLSSSTFKIVVIILYSSRLRLWKKKKQLRVRVVKWLGFGCRWKLSERKLGNLNSPKGTSDLLGLHQCKRDSHMQLCVYFWVMKATAQTHRRPTAGPLWPHLGYYGSVQSLYRAV